MAALGHKFADPGFHIVRFAAAISAVSSTSTGNEALTFTPFFNGDCK
jgi:hypothetical protein